MGENSLIQWTDHTFNPWRGCMKVSEGCKNCYAETFVTKRQGLQVWGQNAPRRVAVASTWRNPIKWNRSAEAAGVRKRVFCASLADVFEDYAGPDAADVEAARRALFQVIGETRGLDWLLLTKRPQNILKMVPRHWLPCEPGRGPVDGAFPSNVWIGCTVENQERADERLPHLLRIPAAVRFVSYEPALGPVDFTPYLPHEFNREPHCPWCEVCIPNRGRSDLWKQRTETNHSSFIDWVIVGGESGPGARPFNPAWADDVVSSARKGGTAVFVKQMGSNPTLRSGSGWGPITARKGDDMAEWSAQLRVREIPQRRGV